jgi:hypothetical protein
MPTHSSKTQKLQNVSDSEVERRGVSKEVEAVAKTMVRRREGDRSWYLEMRRLKRREPSMTAAMKEAKIMPRGREEDGDAAFRAGVQKKTKRYIEPSKKQDARPRVRMRLSVRMVLRMFLAGSAWGVRVAGLGSWSRSRSSSWPLS